MTGSGWAVATIESPRATDPEGNDEQVDAARGDAFDKQVPFASHPMETHETSSTVSQNEKELTFEERLRIPEEHEKIRVDLLRNREIMEKNTTEALRRGAEIIENARRYKEECDRFYARMLEKLDAMEVRTSETRSRPSTTNEIENEDEFLQINIEHEEPKQSSPKRVVFSSTPSQTLTNEPRVNAEPNSSILRRSKPHEPEIRFEKSDVKLTANKNYSLWKDKIITQIKANNLMFVIDRDYRVPDQFSCLSSEKLLQVRNRVRAFIVEHLDEENHRLVVKKENPMEIMEFLEKMGAPENKFAACHARSRFHNLKFVKGERSITEFLLEFEQLVDEIRRHENGEMSLPDEIAIQGLLLATEEAYPLVSTEYRVNPECSSLEKIRASLLQSENREAEQHRRASGETALLSSSRKGDSTSRKIEVRPDTSGIRCFRCNERGHYQSDCKRKGWLCYECHEFVNDHVGDTCPKRISRQKREERSEKMEKNFRYADRREESRTSTKKQN